MRRFYISIAVLLLIGTALHAQNRADTRWQYEAYPALPFQLQDIQLDVQVDPSSALIQGAGRYQIKARQPGVAELVFNTSDIEIQTVMQGETELNYRVSEDSLIISLPDTLKLNDTAELLITWQSSSSYGIHKDVYGNMWTSLNPKARRHWLPIPDHPRVESPVEATITIPAEKTAVFNGELIEDEVVSTDEKTLRWRSEKAVPVTGISLAVGNYVRETARSGVKRLTLYSAEQSIMPEIRSRLLQQAINFINEYEDKLSYEFPYPVLNIVVLPDHQWEEIQAGAGIIYLYQNLGSLPAQLKRGIVAQWLGNYQRYLDAPSANYELLRTILTGSAKANELQNADSLLSINAWNSWQQEFANTEADFFRNTLSGTLPNLIDEYRGVVLWDQYADFWYRRTGTFWDEVELPRYKKQVQPQQVKSDNAGYVYKVDYNYDEASGQLNLLFSAQGKELESLAGLQLTEYGFADTTRSEISFTGSVDTVTVQVSRAVEYVTLNNQEDLALELQENKPMMFWVNQLRSSEPELRKQAAIQLQAYADEPDLQLAIRDVLRTEDNEEVRAALYSTLGTITGGDTGTEQTFLNLLNSDDRETRLEAIKALSNYPGNENVSYSVRNVIRQSPADTVFRASVNTYKKIASTGSLLEIIQRFEQSAQNDQKAIYILERVVAEDTTGQALPLADEYLEASYPYSIRKSAFNILLRHENSAEYWRQELESLLSDRDPRIRYKALDAVLKISSQRAGDLLEERAKDEFDPRILEKIERLRNR
ncbi:HEAT repeat domain-containing protein [Gracilimonas mengyeensis]|uniref:HEAT repeat-containing protein n=1 Tax=Gracilimonas mengyeensis TaxID=1302730 RepID=A0A521E9T5_9BACT|nr:HEAT repeat domain-containing protein [Gracilimonas mengyeensis]SMO80708.1 HEAT repeat-containing protein [Gracilimonas mengyeensis]